MTIIRWLFRLVAVAALIWCAYTVPLGKRTLVGHIKAIFTTSEAKDLASGTKEGADKLVGKARELQTPKPPSKPPSDQLNETDRRSLDHLIQEKTKKH